MPVTTYISSNAIPEPDDYIMDTPPGHTYYYYTGVPEVPFGFGLSYTTFEYSSLAVSSDSIKQCRDTLVVTVTVQNTGSKEGEEVVQVYLSPPANVTSHLPNIQMVGFERILLKPSDKQEVTFSLNPYLMSLVDNDGVQLIFPGKYTISVGGALPGKSTAVGEINAVTVSFTIEGTESMEVSSCHRAIKCLAC